jgi:hypothetical protein
MTDKGSPIPRQNVVRVASSGDASASKGSNAVSGIVVGNVTSQYHMHNHTVTIVPLIAVFALLAALLTLVGSGHPPQNCGPAPVVIDVKAIARDTTLGTVRVRCTAPPGYRYQLFTRFFWNWNNGSAIYYAGNQVDQVIPDKPGISTITLHIKTTDERCYVAVAVKSIVPRGSASPDLPPESLLRSDEEHACLNVNRK